MPKETTETKTEKQAVKRQPSLLKDNQLDEVQGGVAKVAARRTGDGFFLELADPDS